MSGQIIEWFYHDLAGIQRDENVPAFKKIVIKPALVGDLTWVKVGYDSIQGRIVSEWRRDGQSLTLHVVLPANTSGTVYVPARDAVSVREGGRAIEQATGVQYIRRDGAATVYAVSSGDYTFTSTWP